MKSLTVKTNLKTITIFYIISRINLTEHDFILISLWYFCFFPFTFFVEFCPAHELFWVNRNWQDL